MAMGFRGVADFRDIDLGFVRAAAALRLAVLALGIRFLGGSVAVFIRCNRLAHVAGFCERG
jgi:hypothetical protein